MKQLLFALSLFLGLSNMLGAQESTRAPWSARTVELFATLPVQEGGRVKPLDTFAQFRLLRFNAKRSLTTSNGERLGPTTWLLDCFFFPDLARGYRTFLVRDQRVLDAIGVRVEGRKKSDRYSYDELLAGKAKLFSEAGRVSQIEAKERSGFDSQLHDLAVNLRDFEDLIHALDFARITIPAPTTKLQIARMGTEPLHGVCAFLERVPTLQEDLQALDPGAHQAEVEAMEALIDPIQQVLAADAAIGLFPPAERAVETWNTPFGAVQEFTAGLEPTGLALLGGWEAMEHARGDPAAFERALSALHGRVTSLAEARGEYAKVALEYSFYKGDYFTRALVLFLGAFVLLAGSWLAPRTRWLVTGVWGLSLLGTLSVVVGVVLRCIIRGRPPVSTLYETILFITAVIVIVCLVIERIQRQRIALALVPVLGAAGMFLATKYELKEAVLSGDTMPSLVAVLDTNFWLATHVTTITMGYAAGLLAAVLGNLWLIGTMIGLKRGDKDFYRAVSRMTYGVVCFGLMFSVVGTILGGVWANYSWGRFWGWDPKENGALLICLGELFILHARMGGYIREHGLAALAALNGLAVAFSWWHVNNLGVGMHSYGKTEGVLLALYTYYGLGLLVVLGSFLWRSGARQVATASVGAGAR